MAGGGTGIASGRRKSLDAELNLVPFIDLLSMCICFLLMTAVWMEVSGVNVKQLVGTEASPTPSSSFEMDIHYRGLKTLEINLKRAGQKPQALRVEGETNEIRLIQLREKLNHFALALKLPETLNVKSRLQQNVAMARVTTQAGVSYGEIVSIMDTLRDLGIVSLGLVPVRE